MILLFTWGNKSSFDGYNCPVQKIKVTEGGPIFDLQKLGYGNEFVLTNQYPQLSKQEVLVIGVLISINLCRKNSNLKVINLEGNAIDEEVFLRYVLSAISFDTQRGYGGTFLLRHPDLCLDEHKIQVLLERKYFIEDVDDAEGTDYVYRRKRVVPTNDGQDKNYSPIESINFSRNKVVSFYRYFNHHPNLKHLNLGHTEYCGKRMLYTMDEKGNLRPEIKKGSKFDVEDRFTTQPKYYIQGTEEVDKRRRLYIKCLKVGAGILIRSSFHSWNKIVSLNLSGCGLYGHPATMIRKILADSKGYVCPLEHLDLSLNALKPTEVADIVESLRDNSRLKSLNLNSTCVFGEVWSKLSLDPDIISDFSGGDSAENVKRSGEEGENEFNELFYKMSNALEPNQTLEHLDLGNTELLANHIDTLTSQLRHPNPESNGHRQVVGDESISLLGKRMEREY